MKSAPEAIVVELVVASERGELRQADRVGEEDLRSSVRPHLQNRECAQDWQNPAFRSCSRAKREMQVQAHSTVGCC